MKILKLTLGGPEKGQNSAPLQSVAAAQAFSQFAQTFRVGPVPGESSREPDNADLGAQAALEEFLHTVPNSLRDVRSLFSDISRYPSLPARQDILTDICLHLGGLKKELAVFQLRPAWQLASALQGLFQQLIDKPFQPTLSTLRTAASALVLLDSLCVPGLPPDLAHNPTVRILVVDDDLVCCQAVLMSLKQSFAPPDVAEDGEAALALATRKPYDLVFLDTEMSGMDGYEACIRIHETEANRNTPVIFVTSHSDFDSRAKSNWYGGKDLIAKPFLSAEITVKALTLVLRKHLDEINFVLPETTASPALVAA